MLDEGHGVVLGLFDDEVYQDIRIDVKAGDILYLYTDGVTEAVSGEKTLYTNKRLEKILDNWKENRETENGEELIELVKKDLKAFVGETEQSDDITMLSLYLKKNWKMVFPAKIPKLKEFKEWFLKHNVVPEKLRKRIYLAIEEIFVNICSYAYDDSFPEEDRNVSVSLSVNEEELTICFRDGGVAYNPLERVITGDEYDIDSQIGGLGKMVAFQIMDKQEYHYENNQNILILKTKI